VTTHNKQLGLLKDYGRLGVRSIYNGQHTVVHRIRITDTLEKFAKTQEIQQCK